MKSGNSQRGAAIVEFAVLISLLIILLFGIFEFGFLWLNSYYIANSAREGARVAAKIGGGEAADSAARSTTAENAAKEYLKQFGLFKIHYDEVSSDFDEGFVTVSTTDGYLDADKLLTLDGGSITVPLVVVTVTVQTSLVWEPFLWPLTGSGYGLSTITQTASFAIE